MVICVFKILLNRKRLNDIANVARKHLQSSLHYTIPSVTQAVLSYDLLQAVQNDPVICGYRDYIGAANYKSLYSIESPENILHIPDYFGYPLSYVGSSETYIPSIIHYPNCSYIGKLAFYSFRNLQTAIFDKCEIIDIQAFAVCKGLTTLSFPNCKRINYGAFNNCTALQSVFFPECTTIEANVFQYCTYLSSINMPRLRKIGYETFQAMSGLREVYFQDCTIIGSYAFDQCFYLSHVEIPNCLYIGQYAFRSCKLLSTIEFNSSPYIDEHAFENGIELSYISFASCTKICDYAFYNCEKLESIMFLGETVPVLDGSMIFAGTPLAINYSGARSCKMYVRESLFSKYARAMSSVMNTEALAVFE